MKKRIFSIIVILVFIISFFVGLLKMRDIILLELHKTKNVKDTQFIINAKELLKKIDLSNQDNGYFEKEEDKDEFYVNIYYIMLSPKKEVGLYYNKKRYLLNEGDKIGEDFQLLEIRPNSIEVLYKNDKYWITK